MRSLGRYLSIVLAALLLSAGLAVNTERASAVEITPVGERAFEDVTRCLTSGKEKKLDVFYLIDQSGSLSWTDPDNARVEILRNSVSELGLFVEQGVEVRVGAAGFANGTNILQEWTPVSSRDAAAAMGNDLGEKVLQAPDAYTSNTDWEAGLRLAKGYFDEAVDSCSMLIWFTDGGINPGAKDATESLSDLCQPGISTAQIPAGQNSFGLMQEFRTAGIPIFGVLLNNEESSREHYQRESPAIWKDLVSLESWLMSFMRPLVEGSGTIPAFDNLFLAGGDLTCAELDAEGFALAGQANGAFIDAADPVALAFQFMGISGQISGGNGIPIVDGAFFVPAGTAGFQVIVSSEDWALSGPEGSEFAASAAAPGPLDVSTSGGASRINVPVGQEETFVGDWALDTSAQYAELFLFTGLTIELDRDKVSTVLSDFDNTLSGRVARVQEFSSLPVDLGVFSSPAFTVSILDDGVLVPQPLEVDVTPDGQFKIEGFNPGQQVGDLELWLTLNLGEYFQPITSQFVLSIVDKSALATPSSDVITLSTLEGPEGVARGELVITGPNISQASTFCVSGEPMRLDDVQALGDQPVERVDGFTWSFSGLTPAAAGNCVDVANGEVKTITIEARNPTQANAAVVSSWQITSTTEGTAASYNAPIAVQFDSATQTNTAVEIAVIAALLIAGIVLPLLVMWLINFAMTRFLPIESVMRAAFPVLVDSSGPFTRIVSNAPGSEGVALTVNPTDFRNLMDQPAKRVFDTELGSAQAKIPLFPLAQTWYQWQAPRGHRIVSVFEGGTKNTKEMATGQSVEISPNMQENWALVLPDAEVKKPAGEKRTGQMVVFSRMSTLDSYQKRVSELTMKPGLGERIDAIGALISGEAEPLDGADTWSGIPTTPTSPIPTGFTPSTEAPDSPLSRPKPPTSGPLAPPPPPQ
jgi:hypothetical protein